MRRLITLAVISLALPAMAASQISLQVQIGLNVIRQMSFFLGSDTSWQEGREGKFKFRLNVRPKEDKASIHCQIYEQATGATKERLIGEFQTETPWGKQIEEVQVLKEETFRLKLTPIRVQ